VCSQSRYECDSGAHGLLTMPAPFSVCYDVSLVARTLESRLVEASIQQKIDDSGGRWT
jgi:hypothetical protein